MFLGAEKGTFWNVLERLKNTLIAPQQGASDWSPPKVASQHPSTFHVQEIMSRHRCPRVPYIKDAVMPSLTTACLSLNTIWLAAASSHKIWEQQERATVAPSQCCHYYRKTGCEDGETRNGIMLPRRQRGGEVKLSPDDVDHLEIFRRMTGGH